MSDLIKAKKATIILGSVELVCYQKLDGSYWFSQNQMKEQLQILSGDSTGKKHMKPLLEAHPLCVEISKVENSNTNAVLIEIELFKQIVSAYAGLGNKACVSLLMACFAEALERRADAAFGVIVSEPERDKKIIQRLAPICTIKQRKAIRKTLMDRYHAMDGKKGLFPGTTSKVYTVAMNQAIFGCDHFRCNRFNMTSEQQYAVGIFEANLHQESFEHPYYDFQISFDKTVQSFLNAYGDFYHVAKTKKHLNEPMTW